MGLDPTYLPASRRPIADVFRRTARAAVDWCVRRGVHPDTVSYASVVAAAGAAACFVLSGRWPWLLLVGPLLCFLRLWCNMLDGMVAMASGKASPRGEIVNELPDRVSDVLIFVGVAHSGWANPFLAYWAAILAVMTAYVGTLGQAVTGRRRFEGWMSKQWRMVVLTAGAWGMWGFVVVRGDPPQAAGYVGRLSMLDWVLCAILLGCVQTIVVRLVHILRDLRGAR
jgi:phosphatidylglycerophosphate synthase